MWQAYLAKEIVDDAAITEEWLPRDNANHVTGPEGKNCKQQQKCL